MLAESDVQSIATFSFISGNDDYLVDREGKKRFSSLSAHLADDFAKEIIHANAQTVSQVDSILQNFTQSVQTLSLFGEEKVVWLRGVNFLADTVTGRAEGTKALVEKLQATLTQLDYSSINILITASPVDKRTRGYKQLSASGTSLNIPDSPESIISQECKALGVNITREAQEILVANLNGNSRLITQEINKLATFLGNESKTIDAPLVINLVPQFGEGDFFEFSEAFFSLDLQWTLDSINRYFFSQKESRPLISSLQNRLRILIQLRTLIDSGSLSYSIDKPALDALAQTYTLDLKVKSSFNIASQNPWYLSKLASTARNIPLRKLIDFQQAILTAFEALLIPSQSQESVMKNLVLKCLT